MGKAKEFFSPRVMTMGLMHMLVAFTSIAVVTSIVGFNMQTAFLFAGIGTLIFHIATKNKLPMVMGVSGLYIGGTLFVVQTYGQSYAHGGIIVAGLVYVVFGLLMFKWQDKILPFFPNWLLSTVVLLIGLNLLPIGVSLVQDSLYVGGAALIATALVDMFGGKRLAMFAMPIGVIAGTIVAFLTTGIDTSVLSEGSKGFEFIKPEFNLEAALSIGMIAIAVIFEMMGDTKNTGNIIGKNVFKEVGLGRISLGNGLATIVGGAGSSNAYTTYSESTAFVMLSRYYNPLAQLWTALLFIVIAFLTPVMNLIKVIPMQAFGGVVTYLFALVAINAIKQIAQSGVDLDKERRPFAIMIVMLAVSSFSFVFVGVSFSSVAIATIIGVLLNSISSKK